LSWYLLLGLTIGGGMLLLARRARAAAAARLGFLVVTASWLVLTGLAGLILAGLWGVTDHVMAYRNENLLQLDPLALALLPAAFAAVRGAGAPPWSVKLAQAIALLSLLGLAFKLLPGFDQVNGPIIALALPAQLGVASAFTALARRSGV
jgi:hypothetical protein